MSHFIVTDIAVLKGARRPVIQHQVPKTGSQAFSYAGPNGKPVAVTEGIATNGAVVSWVGARMSEESPAFAAYLRIDNFDATTVYGLKGYRSDPGGSGWDLTATAEADEAATLAALKTDLELNATFIALGGVAELLTTPTDILKFTVNAPTVNLRTLATGAGTASLISDSRVVIWRVWGLPVWYSQGGPQWEKLEDGKVRISRGPVARDRVCSAGYQRIYVEIMACDGLALPRVGPCELEESDVSQDSALQGASDALGLVEPAKLLFPTSLSSNVDVVNLGAENVTGQAVVAGEVFGTPIVWPGAIEPPFSLPPFDLVIRNAAGFTVALHRNDDLDSLSLLEIEPGEIAQFGPFEVVDKPWQFSAPSGGAGAADVNVDYEIMWR